MTRTRIATALGSAVLVAAVSAPAQLATPAAAAVTWREIHFDGGTAGTRCAFLDVNPLRGKYDGVHFRGPGELDGGAILDTCSDFGVEPRSGLRFLAFNNGSRLANGGIPQSPERITFDSKKKAVRIFASQGDDGGGPHSVTFSMAGRRAGRTVDLAMVTTATTDWTVLKVRNPNGIKSVIISTTDPDGTWVADDLGWRN